MLFNSHISITDFILDSRDNRTCPLLQHEDFGGAGDTISSRSNSPSNPNTNLEKYGFAELRKKSNLLRNSNDPAERARIQKELRQNLKSPDHARPAPKITPTQITDEDNTVFYNTSVTSSEPETTQNTNISDILNSSNTLKNNNSKNFYIKSKDKEYGPLKFLVLLSLLKQNKLKPDIKTRTESETEYHDLTHYLPKDILQTIRVAPVVNSNILPKTKWLRKNVRIDYDDIVLLTNESYSLAARSIDLSAGGISVIWVYDIPLNEKFAISLFDIEKNIYTVNGILTRKETLPKNNGYSIFKAIFLFEENIQIKNFIK